MAKKTDTKKQILTAAAKLINEDGILALTLDAVAKLAGISKGGLLYHFPSKEALLEGIVNYLTQDFTNGMTSAVQEDLDEKGKWTRAYTTLTFNQENEEIALNTAFLSAVATNPELLKPMAESLEKLHYQIDPMKDYCTKIILKYNYIIFEPLSTSDYGFASNRNILSFLSQLQCSNQSRQSS